MKTAQHLPILDGLRGLAAMAVVFGHCAGAGFLPSQIVGLGQVGVTTFFALSGFLMAHLYLRRPFNAGELRLYSVARVARIVPLYWLVAGGASVLLYVIGTSLYGIMDFTDVLANLLFIQGNGVFWSIPVEIHFYLIFPVLWWLTARGMFWTGLALILTVQAALAFLLNDVFANGRWIFFWLHIFLIGGAVAWHARPAIETPLKHIPAWAHICAWICVLLIVLSPAGMRQTLGWTVYPSPIDPLTAGLALALLIAAVYRLGPMPVLNNRPCVYLGKISFGIYLLHVPFLIVARELEGILGSIPLGQTLFVVAGTIVASHISFVIFEAPAAKYLRSRTKRSAPAPSSS